MRRDAKLTTQLKKMKSEMSESKNWRQFLLHRLKGIEWISALKDSLIISNGTTNAVIKSTPLVVIIIIIIIISNLFIYLFNYLLDKYPILLSRVGEQQRQEKRQEGRTSEWEDRRKTFSRYRGWSLLPKSGQLVRS